VCGEIVDLRILLQRVVETGSLIDEIVDSLQDDEPRVPR